MMLKSLLVVLLVVLPWSTTAFVSIRAVNLGGHLVPEPFIEPTFWEAVNTFCPKSKDIWNLCECTSQNPSASAQVKPLMRQHLQSFLNLTHLKMDIVQTKINTVRYPISFTYFLDPQRVCTSLLLDQLDQDAQQYQKYASCGVVQSDLDASSFESVLKLMRSLNVRVILDLHQVEGCQNGFDNGGHAGVIGFYNAENAKKGVNTWDGIMKYLADRNLLHLFWGFEILNEPVTSTDDDLHYLQQFTEAVVNDVLYPRISSDQYIVLQPGPGNDKVDAYQAYKFPANYTNFVFDLHEYICFGQPLYLTTMDDVINLVQSNFGNNLGVTKWPYFVGEWSMASTDCAQYLNGAWGGFDPDYYKKQHENRNTFECNKVDQTRGGQVVGFQTCSTIVDGTDNYPFGYCSTAKYQKEYAEYRASMCSLFSVYLKSITSNALNKGYAFWTYRTGSGVRRIQQWDFSWMVEQGIVSDLRHPPTVEQCKSRFL